jgi:MoxR-like ATPase
MKFQGSDNYVATQDLMLAVNAAITLKRPLLVKGEPGTGKTMLAEEVAEALNCRCCSGTSRAPPRPSKACTNTTP